MLWKVFVLTTAFLLSLNVFGAENPKMVNVALERSYIPIGFDDNDKVQVMVAGVFPSSCYKVSTSHFTVDEERKTIHVRQTAYFYDTDVCISMVVPFTQVVNVGLVRSGEYKLHDAVSGKWLGNLPVSRATHPGADDYLYAPINDAFLIVDGAGTKTLTLLGEFSDRCTIFKDVQVHYYPEVIVVQPIAGRIEGRCEPEMKRFSKTIELDPSLKGTYLLHVRSLNGQAINKLVDASFIE